MLKSTILVLVSIAILGNLHAEDSKKRKNISKKRIGIYDSRAIAIAFVGSEVYRATAGRKLAGMMKKYNKAKAEGDKQKIKELKKRGKAQQALLHKQAFSTASIENILKHITDRLQKIKKQTGVDMIVSKWDTQTLAKHKSAEQVDITMFLVEAFKPNDRQLKCAKNILKKPPVALDKFKTHSH